jgi:hypothetical protein
MGGKNKNSGSRKVQEEMKRTLAFRVFCLRTVCIANPGGTVFSTEAPYVQAEMLCVSANMF